MKKDKKSRVLDKFEALKERTPVGDIALFNGLGEVILTTQEDDLKAEDHHYALISGAVDMISQSYKQHGQGITVELEDTEFFLHYAQKRSSLSDDLIVGLEYEPCSMERSERKRLTNRVIGILHD